MSLVCLLVVFSYWFKKKNTNIVGSHRPPLKCYKAQAKGFEKNNPPKKADHFFKPKTRRIIWSKKLDSIPTPPMR